ncbi:TRAP transporter small permease [Telmatospirillum sp. J64-1]|uniref:TRAP transporter small permease n=1 Tax=Telmatospirillum sp. J64-1 TaxID=2502183 RepID=UPI00115E4539|nr:TRAP transporter small permease [Telmatospirillum sp. J64-1]
MAAPTVENPELGSQDPNSEWIVVRVCRHLSEIAILAILVIVGSDIITRTFFNFSFEVADEIGGYMLAALAFFSLAVTQANNGFHRVEILQDLLSQKNRLLSRIVFDLVTLFFVLLLLWVFTRFGLASFHSGNVAPTHLRTPLWLAQLPMVLGLVTFAAAIVGTVVCNIRRLCSLKDEDEPNPKNASMSSSS